MTRLDAGDATCDGTATATPSPAAGAAARHGGSHRSPGPRADLLEAREVPLGGLRAMTVTRALPQRALPTIGAWCFLDRFGPQDATMRVEPHPHIGLQTVTWPLVAQIRHRDSLGSDVVLRPGELNLMTSGRGIAHSEYSLGDEPTLIDALQLWVALPESRRHGDPAFERHTDLPRVTLPASAGPDASAVVVMGTLAGVTSPATAYTPLVGAQLTVPRGTQVTVPLNPAWEHAITVLHGAIAVGDGLPVPAQGDLLYLGSDRGGVTLASAGGATVFLLGGEPLQDDLVMWWNFVARTHEEIVEARDAWEAGAARFGRVDGHGDVRIPAPPLPAVRLLPRQRGD